MKRRRFLWLIPVLGLLAACGKRQVCDDPTALNYQAYYPESNSVNNRLCKYGPSTQLAGNWVYTDTFTYYPPAGGNPQIRYTPHIVNMQFTNQGGTILYITGLSGQGGSGTVTADKITLGSMILTIHYSPDTIITFADGLTNSTIAFMRRQ